MVTIELKSRDGRTWELASPVLEHLPVCPSVVHGKHGGVALPCGRALHFSLEADPSAPFTRQAQIAVLTCGGRKHRHVIPLETVVSARARGALTIGVRLG